MARHGRSVRVAGDRRPARSLVVVLRWRGGAARRRVAGVGAGAMTVGVVSPGMLLLLLAVPLVVLVGRRRRGTLWAAVLRTLAAVAIVLVPAGAYVQRARPSGGARVVLAVDVCASVARARLGAPRPMPPAPAGTPGPRG